MSYLLNILIQKNVDSPKRFTKKNSITTSLGNLAFKSERPSTAQSVIKLDPKDAAHACWLGIL